MQTQADYRVFPQHVGHWEGVVRVLNPDLQEIQTYKIAQHFEAKDHQWVITNSYIQPDGSSQTHRFDVVPVGNGWVEVTTEVELLKGARMNAIEHGENTIDFKVYHPKTGKLQEMETITLISDRERVRTAQMFNPDGSFRGLLVITETKVE